MVADKIKIGTKIIDTRTNEIYVIDTIKSADMLYGGKKEDKIFHLKGIMGYWSLKERHLKIYDSPESVKVVKYKRKRSVVRSHKRAKPRKK